MRSRLISLAAVAALLGGLLLATPAAAKTDPVPQPMAAGALAALAPPNLVPPAPSPEQLNEALMRIARESNGRVRLGTIGLSNEGRPIRLASVGRGPVRVLYVTQQHGNEPLGTPAAVRALWALGVPNSLWHVWLRSQVTIDIVVQANPDGAVRNQRHNHDPSASGPFTQPGVGYDINRFHNPLTPIEQNPVPEARAILHLWYATRPAIVVDYHMQGRYRQPDGQETTASILWPTNPQAQPPAVTRSRQVAVRNYDAMTSVAGANVTRYPGELYEGIARNAYGILGSASLLVELSGSPIANLSAEQVEFQIRTAFVSMIATAQGAADRTLWLVNEARADAIPPRGRALPNPTTAVELESADAA